MVDLLNIGGNGVSVQNLGNIASTGANATYMVIFFTLIFVLFFGLIWFILWNRSYNIKFRIWVITGTKSLCIDDKAKLIKKKGEAPKWKLKLRKDFVPIPQDDCISIDKKGKLCVEAFYTENGQYIYKKHINDPVLDINDPLTTVDKEFYLNAHIDAVQKYKKKDWLQLLSTLAPLLICAIIIIFLFAFWGQVVKPFKEIGDTIIKERQEERQFLQEMHDIHRVVVGGSNQTNTNNPYAKYGLAPS